MRLCLDFCGCVLKKQDNEQPEKKPQGKEQLLQKYFGYSHQYKQLKKARESLERQAIYL